MNADKHLAFHRREPLFLGGHFFKPATYPAAA
jgi:hypothetical protein